MGKSTKIQWCDSTCNCTSGCQGCELWSETRKSCYAGGIHTRFSGSKAYPGPFEEISLHPGRMAQAAKWPDITGKPRPDKPWLDGLPRLIFVSDMSDAMSADVGFDYLLAEIIEIVASERGSRHRWLWLTKQPQRMASFSSWLQGGGRRRISWPRNLWVGTSITTQATTTRVKHLLNVGDDYTKRFVSVEPMIEPIDLMPLLLRIDWCIFGGESGPQARPFDLDWARKLIAQCRDAGTAPFFKQYGAKPYERAPFTSHGRMLGGVEFAVEQQMETRSIERRDSHGGDWSEWAPEFRVREVPR